MIIHLFSVGEAIESAPGWYLQRKFLIGVASLVFLLPLCLPKTLRVLSYSRCVYWFSKKILHWGGTVNVIPLIVVLFVIWNLAQCLIIIVLLACRCLHFLLNFNIIALFIFSFFGTFAAFFVSIVTVIKYFEGHHSGRKDFNR